MRWCSVIIIMKVVLRLFNKHTLIINIYIGYLPPKEVANLSLAYSTVYHLGFDQGKELYLYHFIKPQKCHGIYWEIYTSRIYSIK